MRRVVMIMMIFIVEVANAEPQGFLWYNEQEKMELSQQTPTQRINSLKQQFNKAKNIAIDNPTLENTIIAQRLQKQIMDKAQKFATMWQLATLLDHKLININEPTNSLHKKLYEEKLEQENALKLKSLAKNWGLILQISRECPYCKTFIPIVQQFANKYKFQLIFVSNSEFQNINTIKDTGLLQKLNPENVVPILYLVASNGQKIYLIARGIVSEDKITENIMNIDQYYKIEVKHE